MRVTFVDPDPASAYPVAALRSLGWDVHVLRTERRAHGGGARLARALMMALGPGLVHLPGATRVGDWSRLGSAKGARMVLSVAAHDAVAPAGGSGEAWPVADALHVESEGVAEWLRSRGAERSLIEVIPRAPDRHLLGAPAPPVSHAQPLRILSVGPLSWTQGYEHALAAVALLDARGVRCEYRIAGVGPYREAIAFARRQLGLERRVAFVAPRARSELRTHFRWASVYLDAAVVPTSPGPALDANAAGIPAVSTDPATHRTAALAVGRRDPVALADALAAIASDTALRARLIATGRVRALSAPREEAQAARLAALYQRVLGPRRQRREPAPPKSRTSRGNASAAATTIGPSAGTT